MEKITFSTRRKKRKTRKCLDEIRSRSRRKTSGNSIEQSSSQHFAKVCILECKTNNRLVTMDRLTLKAMFPKAIRSETITRPALAEIKQKQSVHIADFVRDKQQTANKTTTPLIEQEIVCNTIGTNFHNNISISDIEENAISKENGYNKNDDHDAKSPSSFKLFSPTSPTIKTFTVSQLLNEEVAATSTSPSSQTSQGDYRRHLYEDFTNEIPAYFRQLTSSIIKEDVVKNTINSLKKLYVESCQKEYEDNVLKCINGHIRTSSNTFCNKNETIVDNPLDYIRLELGTQQSGRGRRRAASDSASSGAGAARPRDAAAGALYDSPEYTYYPHRLN